eukprot:scaffold91680_cov107-Phaeocystis_antarctica.AAC.2
MSTTASAVSTSAPERPPPSPAAAAQFYLPAGVAIDPSGTFALVAVRAWPPAPRAPWPSPTAAHPPRTQSPGPHRRSLRCGARRHTPRRRLAPRSACARARCIAGQCQRPHPPCRHHHRSDHHPRRQRRAGLQGRRRRHQRPILPALWRRNRPERRLRARCCACLPPCTRALWPPSPQRRTRLSHAPHRPAPPPSKVWFPPPHTAPPAFAPRSACARARCIAGHVEPPDTEDCHRCASVAADPVAAAALALAAAALALAAAALALAAATHNLQSVWTWH